MSQYYVKEQSTHGFTTPEKARQTGHNLALCLKARLEGVASDLMHIAAQAGQYDPGFEKPAFPMRPGERWSYGDIPDLESTFNLINAFAEAARHPSPVVAMHLDTVNAAKDFLGACNEHTVCLGMDAAWTAGYEKGDWENDAYLFGEVIGIFADHAAICGVSVNHKAGSSSAPNTPIAIVKIADIRGRPQDGNLY
jgi:hypothetical protein